MKSAHVSTANLRPSERLPFWSEVVSRTFAPVEARYVGEGPFHGQVSMLDLGGVRVTRIGSAPMRYDRGRGIVASDPSDDFFIGLTVKGITGLDQDGRQSSQRPGEMVAYDSGRAFTNHFPQPYNQVVLIVPRRSLTVRMPDVGRVTGMTLPCTTAVGRMARGMVSELGSCDGTLADGTASQMAASVLDVLTLAMRVELLGGQATPASGADQLDRIKRYLLEHLEDASLTVERIAKDNAVSVRTLHRLFAANGESVKNCLYEQRLRAGYRALAERRVGRVTDAALAFGFADASHFTRLFKKAYGILPNALLRGAFGSRRSAPGSVELNTDDEAA